MAPVEFSPLLLPPVLYFILFSSSSELLIPRSDDATAAHSLYAWFMCLLSVNCNSPLVHSRASKFSLHWLTYYQVSETTVVRVWNMLFCLLFIGPSNCSLPLSLFSSACLLCCSEGVVSLNSSSSAHSLLSPKALLDLLYLSYSE